jgi:phosphoglycerate dehydrogenase-like enzyme
MRPFRVALTGDFLNDRGAPAYGDAGVPLLRSKPYISHRFLTEQAPHPGDTTYYERFYALTVTPEQIADTDGLIVLRPWVKRSTFAGGAENLIVIGRSGAGYDKIDVAACTENDVALFTSPDALTHATASAAMLFMLALAKRLPEQQRVARAARWDRQADVMGGELTGRTLGIIGLGLTGRELVRLVAPFAMRILAFSPNADPAQAAELGVRLTTLPELLRESDFVSLHCRLTPQTRNLLGATQLSLLKPTAYLVNVGRGELIDQPALVTALRERRIAGAGLDVFSPEPPMPDDPILALDNVIVTPHWLASTADVWRGTARATAEGMLRAAVGEVPDDVVNREVLDRPGFRAKLARFAENRAVSH